MATVESLLFGILVMLFGGFVWLKPGLSLLNGYWIMVAGLLLGLLTVVFALFRQQNEL